MAPVKRKALLTLLLWCLAGLAAWAQVPTSNVLYRVLKIRTAGSTGSAFTIEVDGKQYLITARHLLRGFGARNFSDLDRGLAEMTRVVRPGGRVVVLEITTPQGPPLSTFFSVWFDRVVPAVGRIADSAAYTYLPSSVKRFPGPEALAGRMAAVGLTDIRWILTAGGIIALHVGTAR